MKKLFLLAFILLLSISLSGCVKGEDGTQPEREKQPAVKTPLSEESERAVVTSLVGDFGCKLKAVSLQAPEDTVKKSIQENYGALVSPKLLEKWLSDPKGAPGRMLSSPWPDRIEIQSIKKLPEQEYEVKGEIIEITSEEKVKGGVAAKRPITLVVKKTGERWLIDAVTIGEAGKTNSIVYRNPQYGFSFTLPKSWRGYLVVTDKWKGTAIGGPQQGKTIETGPLVSIRHPQWAAENPRQDIPIMIFTLVQWDSLRHEKFSVGAAPVPQKELGRNKKYVFALPARYNFAFLPGYEEVENILESNPLQPDEN